MTAYWIVTDNGEAPFIIQNGTIRLDGDNYSRLSNNNGQRIQKGDIILFYQGKPKRRIQNINILGIYYKGEYSGLDENNNYTIDAEVLEHPIDITLIRDSQLLPKNMSIPEKVKIIDKGCYDTLMQMAKTRSSSPSISNNLDHSFILDAKPCTSDECIECIVRKTIIDSLKGMSNQDTRLIYPIYSPLNKNFSPNISIRTSEQELKQSFLAHLHNNIDYFRGSDSSIKYSVETPTIEKYKFKNSEIPKVDKEGTSARIDMTIYSSYFEDRHQYIINSHIEFKQGNGTPKEITKDLLKLSNEPYCIETSTNRDNNEIVSRHYGSLDQRKARTHYFIHIVDSIVRDTMISLSEKYFGNSESSKEIYQTIAKNLETTENNIIIYVLTNNSGFSEEDPDAIYRIDYREVINNRTQQSLISFWRRVSLDEFASPENNS